VGGIALACLLFKETTVTNLETINVETPNSPPDISTLEPGLARYEEGEAFYNATVKTPLDEAALTKVIVVTYGKNRRSENWEPKEEEAGWLVRRLCTHRVGKKDGPAVVLGDLVPGQRLNTAVKSLWGVALDDDTGTPTDIVDSKLKEYGRLCVRYSTHSYCKTETELTRSSLEKFAGGRQIDRELIRDYLRTEKCWHSSIVDHVEYVGDTQRSHGFVCCITHPEMPKHRIVFLFKEPFDIGAQDCTQAEALRKWKKIPEAVAAELGLPLDKACLDACHMFYLPRHDEGRPHDTSLFGGPLLDWRDIQLSDPFEAVADQFNKRGAKSVTPEGRALGHWSIKRAHGFQIADVIEAHASDRIRTRGAHRLEIECPFDEHHENAGSLSDSACFVVNAGMGSSPVFTCSCRHNGCRDKTNLDMLGRMIKDQWFDKSVLEDEDFNAILDEDENARGAKTAPEAELVPTLAELKEEIAALSDNATSDIWRAMLVRIAEAQLKPADADVAHTALKARCKIKNKVYEAELADWKRSKKQQAKDDDAEPKEPDETTLAMSDKLKAQMIVKFGDGFHTPDSQIGGCVRLGLIDGKPWYVSGEGTPLCTPFVYDGSVIYPDKDRDRGIRVRVLDADMNVVSAEFDAALLGRSAGNEVISALSAKNWAFTPEGREFVLRYLSATQKSGSVVYHRPGYRDGVFVLATGDVFTSNDYKGQSVELHPSKRIKGKVRGGTLDAWIAASHKVFANPEAQHLQIGVLLGLVGPMLAYLGRDSISVFLHGKSAHAKTTTQMEAAANWAAPGLLDEGFMGKASGTLNAQEAKLEEASCAVMGNDELGKLDPKVQAEYPFLVQGGLGKSRMKSDGTQQATRKWMGVVMIASAEKSLGQLLSIAGESWDAGLTARLLPIDVNDIVKLFGEAWDDANALLANFGHSGPEFIRAMLELAPEAIEQRLEVIVDSLNTKTPLEYRAARNVAYVQLAAEIAAYAGLIPQEYADRNSAECVAAVTTRKLWKGYLESDTPPTDPADRAIETLIANLNIKKGTDVVAFTDRTYSRSREALAYHSVPTDGTDSLEKDKPGYYVIPSKHLAALAGNMASHKAIQKALQDGHYLVRPEGKRGEKTYAWAYVPKLGRFPCLVLDAAKVDSASTDESGSDGEEAPE
jgi:hypothetical protein